MLDYRTGTMLLDSTPEEDCQGYESVFFFSYFSTPNSMTPNSITILKYGPTAEDLIPCKLPLQPMPQLTPLQTGSAFSARYPN